MGFFDKIAGAARSWGARLGSSVSPMAKTASEGAETILNNMGTSKGGGFRAFSKRATSISMGREGKNLGAMPSGYADNILGGIFGSKNNPGIFNRNITRTMNSGVMTGLAGAAVGGTMGLAGNIFAPDIVGSDSPFKSAMYGAAAGVGLGMAKGAARGVILANKNATPWIDKAAKFTMTAADSKITKGALFAATMAGSVNTNFTQSINPNRRA